jgi:hypothetical protein
LFKISGYSAACFNCWRDIVLLREELNVFLLIFKIFLGDPGHEFATIQLFPNKEELNFSLNLLLKNLEYLVISFVSYALFIVRLDSLLVGLFVKLYKYVYKI